jgi:hypothetical protein
MNESCWRYFGTVTPPDAFDVIGPIISSVFVQRVRNAAVLTLM